MKSYKDFEKDFYQSNFKNEPYLKDAWIQNALRTQLEKQWMKQEIDASNEKIIAKFKALPKKDII